jgi:hypothetical protein
MTKLEAILKDADELSQGEFERLVNLLLARVRDRDEDDEIALGRRGLAAWTESAQGEDWSGFYPDSLKNGGSTRP